jgi:6-pyruvoyltetrahydropterin/6-carboxytetrahydropterin synthase
MAKIRLTKIFHFESAHALYGYDGKCRNIHGHSYQLHVTVAGQQINDAKHVKNGMVMDFGDLKAIIYRTIIDQVDHALVLNKNTPHAVMANSLLDYSERILLVDYQPTCENMLQDFVNKILPELPAGVELIALRLYETSTSYAEWLVTDQAYK